MKLSLRLAFIAVVYLFLLIGEGVLGQFTLFPVFTPTSAQEKSSVVLTDLKNISPYASYGLEGFSEIKLQFVISQEITDDLIFVSCPGTISTNSINVDKGIEYSLTYTPGEYCPTVSFSIGDTQISQIKWNKWGEKLVYLLDLPDEAIQAQIANIEDQILEGELAPEGRLYYHSLLTILRDIISSRADPSYLVPVPGSTIPTSPSHLPNAGRPYRETYTDGIHHGWDFYGSFGAPIVALDDGVVIMVKRDFTWDEFESIKIEPNEHHEHTNLDILRGNQVWIKTMTGDVVFYSHFNEVDPILQEGDTVKRGQYLGTIGATGVPFRGYDQYHLHIPLMVNPLLSDKVGKYSLIDIMKWDWYGKHKTQSWILEHQQRLFSYE